MPVRNAPKETPFNQLPRRVKKAYYIAIKNRINESAPILGGKFGTIEYIDGHNSILYIFFLGTKAPIYYNVAIHTTYLAYKAAVFSRASEMAENIVPDAQTAEDFLRILQETNTFPPEAVYPEFDGMTRSDWMESQYKSIADSGELKVYEQWKLRRDYRRGIGLRVIVNARYLTFDVINAFIDRFLASQPNYMGSTAYSYKYDEVPHWSMFEENMLIDPIDWDSINIKEDSD